MFYEYEGIVGKAETAHLDRALQEFWELTGTIRRKLGRQSYLLDKYISCVLEGINAMLLCASADEGFRASSELRNLCISVMDGKTDCNDHPLYEKAKEHIESNPLDYQERQTRLNIYCVALAGDFLEYAAKKFRDEHRDTVRVTLDIVYLHDLYRQISSIVGGEEQMEKLNLLIRQRFLIVTPMAGFLQGLTNDLLYSLASRDLETSKQIFQLVMDNEI